MSADPNSAPAPDPNAPASEASAQTSDKYQFPQVKRRHRRDLDAAAPPAAGGNEPAGTSPEDQLRKEIDGLTERLRLLAEKRLPPPPPEAEARSAKYFRLERKAATPAPAREPGAAAPEPAAPVLPPTERVVVGYHPSRNEGWLLATAGILGLAALAFYLGWLANRPLASGTAPPPVTSTWTEPEITQLDKVFDMERSGNLKGAFHEATSLDKQLGGRRSLEGYAGVLEARSGSINNGEADLMRKIDASDPPRETAAVQKQLGFIYARRRDFNAAIHCFANAAEADPLDPWAFYYWGEALRRAGRLPEAIGKFREVLERLPTGQPESDSLWQCAAFRMRLSQIELGGDADVKTALDAQLGRPVPSVYWLLTAAAYDLQHGDAPAALGVLQRVGVVSSPELLDPLLNDYFLRGFAVRNKAVAEYFPEITPERRKRLDASGACFIDP